MSNKRVFPSIKSWMDELIEMNKRFFEISDLSDEIISIYVFEKGKIHIHVVIEKMARHVAAPLEVEYDGEWIKKYFMYREFEFFQLENTEEKENAEDK